MPLTVEIVTVERKLLEEFAKSCGEEAHPQTQGFFDSVKRFFEANSEGPSR